MKQEARVFGISSQKSGRLLLGFAYLKEKVQRQQRKIAIDSRLLFHWVGKHRHVMWCTSCDWCT